MKSPRPEAGVLLGAAAAEGVSARRRGRGDETLDGFLAGVERRAFRIARQAIWDDEMALDIVQDSMLKLAEKYADRPCGEWPALFFTILNNRIRDARRWRMLRQKVEKFAASLGVGRDGDPRGGGDFMDNVRAVDGAEPADPEAATAKRQLGAAVERAVAELSERQRQVFVLREWQGLDVQETARAMGCSVGSVKQHHFRAMRALRGKLAEVWNEAKY